MLFTFLFRSASDALRMNARKEGLNSPGCLGRFLCLPPCWAPCTSCASIEVMVATTQAGNKLLCSLFSSSSRWKSAGLRI